MIFEARLFSAPVAQGRGKATAAGGFTRVYDPKKSREAKAAARDDLIRECQHLGLVMPVFDDRLVIFELECVFQLPKGMHRKNSPPGRTWLRSGVNRNDADNLAKLYMDAANGVLWIDDAQVVRLVVERWRGAQGEAPYVRVAAKEAEFNWAVVDRPNANAQKREAERRWGK